MAECSSWQPPRPCEAYRAEWKLCRSARHFLHHYYVHGERPACEQWRRDLASCRDWEERRSDEAQVGPWRLWFFRNGAQLQNTQPCMKRACGLSLRNPSPRRGIKDSFPQSFPGR
ncbi:synaptic plasticity regulator PANTS isoform X3 [Saimiri boliviensis]|uniref:synaptic plasticity regulator PANTS isoform X3 n=1 Tax=Saimiri boliviensis TaxID=27679 RepID=UPI000533E730|nr:UPF0545 protein C22orf39 homolog isoform X1 [Saimiri boliviensis boliviensis]XP_039318371.1 UPF0545 protein C22orf39 homolog isoform X1 [Saimiri boliviensis boliviensis]